MVDHDMTSTPEDPTSPWENRGVGWLPLSFTIAFHVVVAGALLSVLANRPAGTTEEPVRSIGMAVAYRMPDRTRYVTQASDETTDESATETAQSSEASQSSQTTDPAVSASSSAPPAGFQPPIDLAGVFRQMTERSGEVADGVDTGIAGQVRFADGKTADQLGDQELVPGIVRAGRGAGQTTTSVFGVSGSGSTFVYVFDHSESMRAAGGKPLRAAKEELIRSLETLTERQQFQIIFYNDTPHSFAADGQPSGLVTGEAATLQRAKEFVARTQAIGGTEHQLALRMALRLAPDVVFFLTDAKIQTMSDAQMDDITRRAESAGTAIHAIQFGTGPAPVNSFLQRLAKRNRGGYRYLDVTQL